MKTKKNHTKKKLMKEFLKWLTIFMSLGILVIIAINFRITNKSDDYIYNDIEKIPKKQVIIVLGAYVTGDNLSLVLEDRVKASLELYKNKKAEKILLSGDHGKVEYDEVNSMRKYILRDKSIAEEVIFLDHAGFDTYDSMYRAREIFEVESAIIVTQEFHINRAVYIARELGIDAVGYSVNEEKYSKSLRGKWYAREYLSRVKAFIDVHMASEPKYLGKKVPIVGDGHSSWD